MLKNTSGQKIALFAFDITTGEPMLGDAANIDAFVNKDWAGIAGLTDTSATEIDDTDAPGWYLFDLTQGETNAECLHFTGSSSTADVVVVGCLIWTMPAAGAVAAVEAKVDTVDTVVDGIAAKTVNLPSDPADQSLIIAATDAIAAYVDTEVAAIKAKTDKLPGVALITFAVVADAGNTASTFKTNLTQTEPDHFKDAFVTLTSGDLAGQTKRVIAFDESTKFLTVSGGFSAEPAAAVTGEIINK